MGYSVITNIHWIRNIDIPIGNKILHGEWSGCQGGQVCGPQSDKRVVNMYCFIIIIIMCKLYGSQGC